MLSLREYRNKADRLADFLPWAALVAPGVVLNKDGSFQRSARFRGPDLDSATPAELIATTARLNSALRRLGAGWAIFVEAGRRLALDYPDSDFPDPASALVEREAELVNYRVTGRYMIVDRLFARAELRLGGRKGQQTVRIVSNRRRRA